MATCPHCLLERATVEIEGLRFHTFSDRWISCQANPEERSSFLDRVQARLGAGLHRNPLPHDRQPFDRSAV